MSYPKPVKNYTYTTWDEICQVLVLSIRTSKVSAARLENSLGAYPITNPLGFNVVLPWTLGLRGALSALSPHYWESRKVIGWIRIVDLLPLLLPLIPEKIDYAIKKLNYGMLMIMWILMIYLVVSYQHGLESLESLSSYSQPRVGYENQHGLTSLESPSSYSLVR